MSSIAEVVTKYQSAQTSYEKAVARAGASADAPWTGKSIGASSRAVAAARHAVQAARLVADAREKLGTELTERILEAAFKAAAFSTEAAQLATQLTIDLTNIDPLAHAGKRTREAAASIRSAIVVTAEEET